MASKVRVTVSLDEALAWDPGGASRKAHRPRSQLAEAAIRHRRRSHLERELKEGYLAMAEADRASAERSLPAGWEAIK